MIRRSQARRRLLGVIETALYVDDLSRAIAFYQGLFGFRLLQQDHRFCAFDVAGSSAGEGGPTFPSHQQPR
jgi:catechol 2,3-dioxygenase-like lactoylglutathione lyase family enzyme